MCYLSSDSWQEWKDKISEILSDSNVMNKLIKNEELCGHLQPGGKITFNQTLNEKSFAQFTKVINDIVPFDVVISGDSGRIPLGRDERARWFFKNWVF